MDNYSEAELREMKPKDFWNFIRKGEYTGTTLEACQNYAHVNLVIVPREYAFEFLLFCNRNPRPCPIVEVTEPGDPEPKQMAPGADVRTDLPRYRVYKNGEPIDEPNDINKYWRDDLVSFLIGCSRSFTWALRAANVPFRRYSSYRTNIPCVPAGRFHGPMVVSVRAFYNAHDAVRAIQISSRHFLMHGPPVHIGDPVEIGIKLGQPDPLNPHRPVLEPPRPGEVVMCWGCGITPQTVAMESKIPFMISHDSIYTFITNRLAEELAVL